MSELWTVALFFRGHGRQVNLLYGGEAAARAVFERAMALPTGSLVPVEDHYGTTIVLFPADETSVLEAVMLQDNTKANDGSIEVGLLQARAQAKANTRAQHDPQLKFVAGTGGPFMGRPG
jgi:hypothetical protein